MGKSEGFYQKRLADTRFSIHQEELPKKKHRLAEDFRQEVAWSNAAMVSEAKTYISSWRIFVEEYGGLKKVLLDQGLPVKENIITSFAEEVINQQNRTKAKEKKLMHRYLGIDKITDFKSGDDEIIGRGLFREITGSKPKGHVRCIFSNLAIILSVEDTEDLDRLSYERVSGLYNHFQASVMGRDLLPYPLIITNGIEGTTDHELGHAVNKVISATLNKIGFKKTFPINYFSLIPTQILLESIIRIFQTAKGVAENILHSSSVQNQDERTQRLVDIFSNLIFPRFLPAAKDELLADIQNNSTGDNPTFEHLKNLCNQDGIYNYFRFYFKRIPFLKKVDKDAVWKEYTKKLKEFAVPAQEFASLSEQHSRLYSFWKFPFVSYIFAKKDKNFSYLLAQYQIEKWPTELQPYILARKNVISALQEFENKVERLNSKKWDEQGLDEKHKMEAKRKIVNDFLKKKFENKIRELEENQSENVLADTIREASTKYRSQKIY